MTDTATTHRSILGSLRDRRAAIADKLYTDIKVPHWDEDGKAPIYVRYAPVPHPFIEKGIAKVNGAPKKQRGQVELETNCDLLIRACEGIYAQVGPDEEDRVSLNEDDPDGEWTVFDPTLAKTLGLDEASSARQVVQALFFTHGDIFSHAAELIDFSGYKNASVNDEFRGE